MLFMATWNDYLNPLLFTHSESKQTVQVAIAMLNSHYEQQTDIPHGHGSLYDRDPAGFDSVHYLPEVLHRLAGLDRNQGLKPDQNRSGLTDRRIRRQRKR